MNLYKWLKFEHSYAGNHYSMNDRQLEFCKRMEKDISQLVEWNLSGSYNQHTNDVIRLYKNNGLTYTNNHIGRVSVGVASIYNNSSYMNIFDIQDLPINEWKASWDSEHHTLYQFCYDKDVDLRKLCYDWLVNYEREIQRKYKLKRVLN